MNQPSSPDLAAIGAALGDESRAAMLIALLDARAWTAGELAAYAGIARSTATAHLDRLVEVRLVDQVRQGRHRYVRIGDARVADAIESLAALSPRERPAPGNLRAQRADAELRAGRTCYRHFAGELGVRLTERWRELGFLDGDWQLTGAGRAWCDRLGVRVVPSRTRPLVRPCLDWTERVEHAAGLMPDAVSKTAFAQGWARRGAHPRSARLTAEGEQVLLGLEQVA